MSRLIKRKDQRIFTMSWSLKSHMLKFVLLFFSQRFFLDYFLLNWSRYKFLIIINLWTWWVQIIYLPRNAYSLNFYNCWWFDFFLTNLRVCLRAPTLSLGISINYLFVRVKCITSLLRSLSYLFLPARFLFIFVHNMGPWFQLLSASFTNV